MKPMILCVFIVSAPFIFFIIYNKLFVKYSNASNSNKIIVFVVFVFEGKVLIFFFLFFVLCKTLEKDDGKQLRIL